MKHPIYLLLTGAACVWLMTAHTRGLNPLLTFFAPRLGPTGAGLHHK